MVDYRRAHLSQLENEEIPDHERPRQVLYRNYIPTSESRPITAGDSITISLSAGFFAEFPELLFTPERTFGRGALIRRGEVAVLARVAEGSGASGDPLLDWANLDSAQLVYFSPDIEDGQPGSFVNLPIYGPRPYEGRPLVIELFAIEIDDESQQFIAALSNLAQVQNSSFPFQPVFRELSQQFLDTNVDDMFFHHVVTFSPSRNEDLGVSVPRLEEGHYVFIRQDQRRHEIIWECLYLSDNDARLYYYENSDCSEALRIQSYEELNVPTGRRYTENTYLTLTIRKNNSSENFDYSLATYGVFREALESASLSSEDDLIALRNSLNEALGQRLAERDFNYLAGLIGDLDRVSARWARVYRASNSGTDDISALLDNSDCESEFTAGNVELLDICVELDQLANEFLFAFNNAVRSTSQNNGQLASQIDARNSISTRQVDLLLSRVAMLLRLTGETLAHHGATSYIDCDQESTLEGLGESVSRHRIENRPCFDVRSSPSNIVEFLQLLRRSALIETAQ